jgi:hypothetical protein
MGLAEKKKPALAGFSGNESTILENGVAAQDNPPQASAYPHSGER